MPINTASPAQDHNPFLCYRPAEEPVPGPNYDMHRQGLGSLLKEVVLRRGQRICMSTELPGDDMLEATHCEAYLYTYPSVIRIQLMTTD